SQPPPAARRRLRRHRRGQRRCAGAEFGRRVRGTGGCCTWRCAPREALRGSRRYDNLRRVRALLRGMMTAATLMAACADTQVEPMKLDGNMLTVDNRSSTDWNNVEIWLNTYYRVTWPSIPAHGRFQAPLDVFVAGFGQRF